MTLIAAAAWPALVGLVGLREGCNALQSHAVYVLCLQTRVCLSVL
jgi:hypothetical protein